MSPEAGLRGILIGLGAFLAASGVVTLAYPAPPAPLQFVQIAHGLVGLGTIAVGVAYLGVHVREVTGRVATLAKRRSALTVVSLVLLAVAIVAMVGFDLDGRARGIANRLAAAGGAGLLVGALRGFVRLVRRPGSKLYAVGTLAALMSVFTALSGVGIATAAALYGGVHEPPWVAHLISSSALVVFAIVHVVQSRGSGAGPRRYPWRAPLVTLAVPSAVVLAAVAAGGAWHGAAKVPVATVDREALVPATHGFSRLQDSCDACHAEVVEGWRGSAHANAANNPLFTALLRNLVEERGPSAARFCLRCHAPHALDPSRGGFEDVTASEGYRAGVHCVTCHRTRPVGGHGDGAFELVPLTDEPTLLLTERWTMSPTTFALASNDGLANVLVGPRLPRHRATYRFASREAESCLPCHVQTLNQPTEGRLASVVQDQYDSWTKSPAAEAGLDCKRCHLPRIVSRSQYLVADHRFLAGSTYVAQVVGGAGAVKDVEETLQGRMPLPEASRFDLPDRPPPAYEPGPLLVMDAHVADADGLPELVVSMRNTGRIGHSFPNGPTDLFQVWIAAKVVDARGHVVLDVGAVGPEGAPRLGHEFRDAAGERIDDHRLWAVAEVRELGRVPTEGSYEVRLPVPAGPLERPLTIRTALRYRRFDPALAARLTGAPAPPLPVVSVATFEGAG